MANTTVSYTVGSSASDIIPGRRGSDTSSIQTDNFKDARVITNVDEETGIATDSGGTYWYNGSSYSSLDEAQSAYAKDNPSSALANPSLTDDTETGSVLTSDALDISNASQTQLDLSSYMTSISNSLFSGNTSDLLSSATSITDAWHSLFDYLRDQNPVAITKTQNLELSSQLFQLTFDWYKQLYTNAYAQSTWLSQQEYNSPVNQVQRLISAGINPAYYYGSLGSGNASSSSSSNGGSSGGSNTLNPKQPGQTPLDVLKTGSESVSDLSNSISALIGSANQTQLSKSQLALNSFNMALTDQMTKSLKEKTPYEISQLIANAQYYDSMSEYQAIINKYSDPETSGLTDPNTGQPIGMATLAFGQLMQSYEYGTNYLKWLHENMAQDWDLALMGFANNLDVEDKKGYYSQLVEKIKGEYGIKQSKITSSAMYRSAVVGAQYGLMGVRYQADKAQATALACKKLELNSDVFKQLLATGFVTDTYECLVSTKTGEERLDENGAYGFVKVGSTVTINGEEFKKITRTSQHFLGTKAEDVEKYNNASAAFYQAVLDGTVSSQTASAYMNILFQYLNTSIYMGAEECARGSAIKHTQETPIKFGDYFKPEIDVLPGSQRNKQTTLGE